MLDKRSTILVPVRIEVNNTLDCYTFLGIWALKEKTVFDNLDNYDVVDYHYDSYKKLEDDFNNRPRRQDFNGVLMENGAFYINSIANIKKNKNRLSGEVEIYEMPEYAAVEIDEDSDWIIAEQLMKDKNK